METGHSNNFPISSAKMVTAPAPVFIFFLLFHLLSVPFWPKYHSQPLNSTWWLFATKNQPLLIVEKPPPSPKIYISLFFPRNWKKNTSSFPLPFRHFSCHPWSFHPKSVLAWDGKGLAKAAHVGIGGEWFILGHLITHLHDDIRTGQTLLEWMEWMMSRDQVSCGVGWDFLWVVGDGNFFLQRTLREY